MSANKVSVVIEKDEFGYYAYAPELEGCHTQGDTLEELMANMKEAVDLYVETLSDDGKKELLSKEIFNTAITTHLPHKNSTGQAISDSLHEDGG